MHRRTLHWLNPFRLSAMFENFVVIAKHNGTLGSLKFTTELTLMIVTQDNNTSSNLKTTLNFKFMRLTLRLNLCCNKHANTLCKAQPYLWNVSVWTYNLKKYLTELRKAKLWKNVNKIRISDIISPHYLAATICRCVWVSPWAPVRESWTRYVLWRILRRGGQV